MIKNIIYSNQELRNFLDKSDYDTISIEGIQWVISKDSNCEPHILAKLLISLPEASLMNKSLFFQHKSLKFIQSLN